MNLTLVTFIGFVVAVLILMWAIAEMTSRYTRQKQAQKKMLDTWLTIKPTSSSNVESANDFAPNTEYEEGITSGRTRDTIDAELDKHVKQNGHLGQHKNSLQ